MRGILTETASFSAETLRKPRVNLGFRVVSARFQECGNWIFRPVSDTKKAMIKAKLATGTYRLQSDKHKFSNGQQSPTCRLCQEDQEDTKHFLLKCKQLTAKRDPYIRKIREIMQTHLSMPEIYVLENSEDLMVQLLVDCTHQNIVAVTGTRQKWLDYIEAAARGLIYALHMSRSTFLRDLYQK